MLRQSVLGVTLKKNARVTHKIFQIWGLLNSNFVTGNNALIGFHSTALSVNLEMMYISKLRLHLFINFGTNAPKMLQKMDSNTELQTRHRLVSPASLKTQSV